MTSFLSALLMAVVVSLAPARAASFLAAVDDLPLMDGLVENDDVAVSFDKPDGRIITTSATGPLAPEDVRRFYIETLPQLGWVWAAAPEVGPETDREGTQEPGQVLIFERERERLRIATGTSRQAATQMINVHFSIEPN